MLKRTMLAAAIAVLPIGAHASIAEVAIGGRFFWPTYPGLPDAGYVFGVNDYNPSHLDNTGVTFGTVVNFNRNPLTGVGPLDLSFISPSFGEVDGVFNYIISDAVTPAGIFYTLAGELNGGAATISINNVLRGVSSFGLLGAFAYLAPTPPPIDPPPCGDCGPVDPPPCLSCGPIDPPPATVVPEASTWLMMLAGFGALALLGWRKRAARC